MRPRFSGIWPLGPAKFSLLLLAGLLSVTPLFAQSSLSAFDRQVLLAQQCVARRDWDGAVLNYRQAVALNPQSDYAYIGLGTALLRKGSLDESAATLAQALALIEKRTAPSASDQVGVAPNRLNLADALDNLAFADYQSNRLEQAFKAEEMAVRAQPNLASCWNTRGMILEAQGKLDEAIASYRKASGLSPRAGDISHNLGEALQKEGRFDDSISVLQQALALNPPAASAARLQTSLGNAFLAKERFPESEAAYRAKRCRFSSGPWLRGRISRKPPRLWPRSKLMTPRQLSAWLLLFRPIPTCAQTWASLCKRPAMPPKHGKPSPKRKGSDQPRSSPQHNPEPARAPPFLHTHLGSLYRRSAATYIGLVRSLRDTLRA